MADIAYRVESPSDTMPLPVAQPASTFLSSAHHGALHCAAISAITGTTLWLGRSLPFDARLTLIVFGTAIWLWAMSRVPDTFVALAAASGLTAIGILTPEELFGPLSSDSLWLLIGAFVLSHALAQAGLAPLVAQWLLRDVTRPRLLVHLLTLSLVCTAFLIPATSGRATLALPVYVAIATALGQHHRWLTTLCSLLIPSVILFSAIASFLGAGAHLITQGILTTSGYEELGFATWLKLGLPLALVSSHLAAEVLLGMFSTPEQRHEKLVSVQEEVPLGASTSMRPVWIICIAVLVWSTESVHHLNPALVAILAALAVTLPGWGVASLNESVKKVPWHLLLFMAATIAMADALMSTGAAEAVASAAFSVLPTESTAASYWFVILVIILSSAAHLVIQSRSARSAVLIPLVIALAPTVSVNPIAAAFISTAAAGLCHSLPASAKPLAIFADAEFSFSRRQLAKAAVVVSIVHCLVIAAFSFTVWPLLGLPLFI